MTFSKVIIIKDGIGAKIDQSMEENRDDPDMNPCIYGY